MTPDQNNMIQDITASAALGGGAAVARQAMSKEPFFTWNFLSLAVMASFVAIVAGLAYAWLYVRTGTLWAPVIAHIVTNALLGGWVVLTGYWVLW
jgi:hypothetical protein